MTRAKAQRKLISRPPIPQAVQAQIAALYTQGMPINQIKTQLEIGCGTAWNYVRRVAALEKEGSS